LELIGLTRRYETSILDVKHTSTYTLMELIELVYLEYLGVVLVLLGLYFLVVVFWLLLRAISGVSSLWYFTNYFTNISWLVHGIIS
jgi:hypothetical protein